MNLLDTASLVVTPNGYKASKLYSIVPSDGSGDMTFARTGDTATRVNSSGLIETVLADKPRLDYIDGSCPKLLFEGQTTNIFTYSNDFSNAIWSKTGTLTSNVVISPDGTQNASQLSGTGCYMTRNVSESNIRSVSIFLKKSTNDTATIQVDAAGSSRYTSVSLLNGTIISYSTGLTVSSKSLANGWFRFQVTSDSNITFFAVSNQFYLYGAQGETSLYPSSYISTTSATVTRNQETASKTSISSLIGQTQGTFFVDYVLSNLADQRTTISDGTSSNRIVLQTTSANNIGWAVISGGVNGFSATPYPYPVSVNNRYKVAIGYKNNDCAVYINGQFIASSSTATIPSGLSAVYFNSGSSAQYFNNKLNSLMLWKTRLTNQELATLTSL
jgi:hypothetical protein